MSIKSRINIIVLLSVVTIIGLYAYIVKVTLEIDSELAQIEKIELFENSVSRLGLITEYYLSHREDRYINSWITLIDEIENLYTEIEEFREYHIISESIPSIRRAFELIVDIKTNPGRYADNTREDELLSRATTRIRSDVRQLMISSHHVSITRFNAVQTLQVDQRLDFLFVLIPVILVLLLMAYMMRRHIISSLEKIQEGTTAFSSGNLDARIELDDDDELGKLADQFNSMASQLQQQIESERQLKTELEVKAAELEKSNEELEQFAYTASHDLKEPLRMIRSFMELLQKKYEDKLDEKAQNYIHFAVDGSRRMAELIDDLLEYSRINRVYSDIKEVDTAELVNSVLQMYAVKIEKLDAKIKTGELPVVIGVPVSLKLIFQNLISNALKYHEEGKMPSIEIGATESATHWEFYISDNGIGIDEEYFEEIFILFKRLHSNQQYQGTGMGLAMCRKAVEQHGGTISVKSKPEVGTTFYFTIKKQGG